MGEGPRLEKEKKLICDERRINSLLTSFSTQLSPLTSFSNFAV
jgi:hypothetical protein